MSSCCGSRFRARGRNRFRAPHPRRDREQRRLFLKFIWGRNRLPLTEDDWGEQHMRIHTLETRRPDGHFPVAHTCFFSIEWPQYSSQQVAFDKLLYAINNCVAIAAEKSATALCS